MVTPAWALPGDIPEPSEASSSGPATHPVCSGTVVRVTPTLVLKIIQKAGPSSPPGVKPNQTRNMPTCSSDFAGDAVGGTMAKLIVST